MSIIHRYLPNFNADKNSVSFYKVCRGYALPKSEISRMRSLFFLEEPDEQYCRCGVPVNLQRKRWFMPLKGCRNHPKDYDKRSHRYKCCGYARRSQGCVRSVFHLSYYRPIQQMVIPSQTTRFEGKDAFLEAIKQVTHRNIFALVCKSGFTTGGYEIIRVSVVDLEGSIVFDSLVCPTHEIVDCDTDHSGICKEMLSNIKATLQEVQKSLMKIFNMDTILVGHRIVDDLLALNCMHKIVVDTSKLFPYYADAQKTNSLEFLAYNYLKKQQQQYEINQDSTIEATLCLELLVHKICEEFKDVVLASEYYLRHSNNQQESESNDSKTSSGKFEQFVPAIIRNLINDQPYPRSGSLCASGVIDDFSWSLYRSANHNLDRPTPEYSLNERFTAKSSDLSFSMSEKKTKHFSQTPKLTSPTLHDNKEGTVCKETYSAKISIHGRQITKKKRSSSWEYSTGETAYSEEEVIS